MAIFPRPERVSSILLWVGWLLPAAIVGLAVFLYGLFTLDENSIANEVCGDDVGK